MTQSDIRIPYSTVRKGARYWELGEKRQKATGLPAADLPAYKALGPDNLKSQREALGYFDAYKAALTVSRADTSERLGGWPEGSLGAAFHLYKQTEDWTVDKKPKTREEWDWCWERYIAPRFGKIQIDEITVADSEKFHRDVSKPKTDANGKPTDGLGLPAREAWSTLKIWRALLKMLEKKHVIDKAPIGAKTNPRPAPRGEFWIESEVARLIRAAALLARICEKRTSRERYRTLGLIMRLAWETALSPVDCRTFSIDFIQQDQRGVWRVERSRTKSGARARPGLSEQLVKDLKAHYDALPAKPMTGQSMFRTSEGNELERSVLAATFANVRRCAFGKGDKRQLQDFRRSANLEADLGGASPEDRAALLANQLDKSKHLDGVYTPVTTIRASRAQRAREQGRQLLKQELGRKTK